MATNNGSRHDTLQDAIDALQHAQADLNERLEAGSISRTFHDALYRKYDDVIKNLQEILDGVEGSGGHE